MLKRLNQNIELVYFKASNYFSFLISFDFTKEKFDHVFSFIRHTNIAVYIAYKFNKLKVNKIHLVEENTFDQQKELSLFSRILQNFLLKLIYNDVDDLIAVSKKIKNEIIDKYNVKKKIRVIGNPCIDHNLNCIRSNFFHILALHH